MAVKSESIEDQNFLDGYDVYPVGGYVLIEWIHNTLAIAKVLELGRGVFHIPVVSNGMSISENDVILVYEECLHNLIIKGNRAIIAIKDIVALLEKKEPMTEEKNETS